MQLDPIEELRPLISVGFAPDTIPIPSSRKDTLYKLKDNLSYHYK
ncbi:unnamed protein product [marine sediment metagenome]|uniref:Uncharacterized protein n=1 Tax=marine sediment metagenome TaxID=412755 RepID=X1L461_9ZZZZ